MQLKRMKKKQLFREFYKGYPNGCNIMIKSGEQQEFKYVTKEDVEQILINQEFLDYMIVCSKWIIVNVYEFTPVGDFFRYYGFLLWGYGSCEINRIDEYGANLFDSFWEMQQKTFLDKEYRILIDKDRKRIEIDSLPVYSKNSNFWSMDITEYNEAKEDARHEWC